ncbi:MAG: hypothetical protein M0P71_17010 [Melioribacteraceae bacterium]|jgi:hypothetical protein|nr:hypothetical protein [Melioribacteraceae bacterium]
MKKQFKEREKRLTIPLYFWDNEAWVTAEKYPEFTVFTDRCLAEILEVSPMRVSMWRAANKIPHTMGGNFAIYNLSQVIQALLKAGYRQDGRADKGGIS